MPKKPYLEAGQVVGTHGVRGEVRVQPWCDSVEQFCTLRTLYWDNGKTAVRVRSRAHKTLALVKLDGVDTVPQAAALRGRVLYLDRRDLMLPEGRHFIEDLIGLKVVDADTGVLYGTLCDVSDTGANNVYHLRMAGADGTTAGGTAPVQTREVLIPAIPDIVIAIDVDGGEMRIRPMKGLFDDDED